MSIDRWMGKEDVVYVCVCVYIYIYIYIYIHIYIGILLIHKKVWINAICHNMDRPGDYHTKWSKSDGERQIYDVTYMWNLTYDINELIYKTETDLKTENKLLATKGESEVKWKYSLLSHVQLFVIPWTVARQVKGESEVGDKSGVWDWQMQVTVYKINRHYCIACGMEFNIL